MRLLAGGRSLGECPVNVEGRSETSSGLGTVSLTMLWADEG